MSDIEFFSKQIVALQRRVEALETREAIRISIGVGAVGNPPTDPQLDAILGQPATLGDGFMAVVDDSGSARYWFVVTCNAGWRTEQLAIAV